MIKTFSEYLEEAVNLEEGKESKKQKEYQAFFQKTLGKYKVKNPAELSKEDKKKFFDEIDKGWEGENESD